jgi:plasmid stability protein
MPALVIKDCPTELHAKLKQEAAKNRRSMTQQAIVLLEQALSTSSAVADKGLPEPLDPGVEHDSEWVYQTGREGRR